MEQESKRPRTAREEARAHLYNAESEVRSARLTWFLGTEAGRTQIAARRKWKAEAQVQESAKHISVEDVEEAFTPPGFQPFEAYQTPNKEHALKPETIKVMIRIMEERMRALASRVAYVEAMRSEVWEKNPMPDLKIVDDGSEQHRAIQWALTEFAVAAKALAEMDPNFDAAVAIQEQASMPGLEWDLHWL